MVFWAPLLYQKTHGRPCMCAMHDTSLLPRYPSRFRCACAVQTGSQLGDWANYVASMSLVQRLSGGSALLVGLVVIIRVLPMLFFFPIAGVVADKCAAGRPGLLFFAAPFISLINVIAATLTICSRRWLPTFIWMSPQPCAGAMPSKWMAFFRCLI